MGSGLIAVPVIGGELSEGYQKIIRRTAPPPPEPATAEG
jgi:hypothetical protein